MLYIKNNSKIVCYTKRYNESFGKRNNQQSYTARVPIKQNEQHGTITLRVLVRGMHIITVTNNSIIVLKALSTREKLYLLWET